MILRKGNSVELKCAFTDASGDAISLTGHTVRFVAYNLYDDSVYLFNVAITSFTGAGSNTATFSFIDEVTAGWAAMEYRYYMQIETSHGEIFTSDAKRLYVSKQNATDADASFQITEGINVSIEDDITIVPGNPTTPVITSGATFSIDEDVSIGTVVGTVTATGSPAPTFSLNNTSVFNINSTTGVITTVAALDFETLASYSLTVTVSNGEIPNATQILTINVNQVAPGAPVLGTVNSTGSTSLGIEYVADAGTDTLIIERSLTGTGGWTVIAPAFGDLPNDFLDISLTPETQYFYRMKGVNEAGESAYSNVVSGTTLAATPTNNAFHMNYH